MNDPDHTKAHKPEQSADPDETVDDVASQPEHPSEDVLLKLAFARLDEATTNSVRTHLCSCNECTEKLRQLDGRIVSLIEEVDSTQSLHCEPTAAAASPDETVDHPTSSMHKASESTAPTFGDYELLSEIARGGMGVVYEARQKSLNRIVALKMIKSGEFANQEQVDRFYKEAEAAAQLTHPGIVPVHEVGASDGQHYFTMGFVDGESLADRLRNGPLPPKEAARYAKSIAEAVAYAHSKGVIHRDLKPGNVLITKDGALRITDFGLAKRIEEDSELTSTGQVLGTPSYMPPEQAEGRLSEVGPAADIYAIGATLYCMLVGRPPFQAANLIETLQQVIHTEPVSLKVQNPAVPTDLETLCLKCLEKKPTSRYEPTDELVDELKRFLNGEPIVARPIGKGERAIRWCKRKPVHATALVAVALIPIIIFGAFIRQTILSRQTAIARVDTLLNASPATIPLVLEELDREVSVVDSRLRELDSQELLLPQQVRVSLALLPYDSSQVEKLKQRLYDCTYDELAVVLDRLRLHRGEAIVPELWTAFRNHQSAKKVKFRTGIALAALDPESEEWTSDDFEFLVKSMLAENTIHQPAIRRSLSSMAGKLVNAVNSAYQTAEPGTLADESSANAIVDFAANDSELLSELSILCTPKQHSVVFPVVKGQSASDESIVDKFVDITLKQPNADDEEAIRVTLGQRRSGAAINLVQLNRPDEALNVLRVEEDPESLTQFVHGCKARGITVVQLLDLLSRANHVPERYGVLLALGDFSMMDIPEDIRDTWVDHIKELYANDPSSGIHSASGWLLRQWGLSKSVKSIDQREVPYSSDRDWLTLKINLASPLEMESYAYYTFVVFPAGEYEIGSPEYESDRDSTDEQQRVVTISRPFAVLDREVTRDEFNRVTGFEGYSNDRDWQVQSSMSSATWYQSVHFCRELTVRRGLGEASQAYLSPSEFVGNVDKYQTSAGVLDPPKNWPTDLSKDGFRLATAAEWEIACRAGTLSRYSFGCDNANLQHYGWSNDNSSNRGHRPRELRPNLKGVFDVHGNMIEWCHDWVGLRPELDTLDPTGPRSGSFRVLMGGGWSGNTNNCRSAGRRNYQPRIAANAFGFRIVFTL